MFLMTEMPCDNWNMTGSQSDALGREAENNEATLWNLHVLRLGQ